MVLSLRAPARRARRVAAATFVLLALAAVTATGSAPGGSRMPSGTLLAATGTPPAATGARRAPARSGTGAATPATRLVGAAARHGGGYWAALADGTVLAAAPAKVLGGPVRPSAPIVAIAGDPRVAGYWLLASNGTVYACGAARDHGGRHLVGAVAIASTPDGGGYWIATAAGRVYAFGDARWAGSAAGRRLARRIVAIAATPDGGGYWLTTAGGGVLAFGDARFRGGAGQRARQGPVVGMAVAPRGRGYWLATAGGQVLAFGAAPRRGSATGRVGAAPVTGIWARGSGYFLLTSDGQVLSFGAPPVPSVVVSPRARRRLPPSVDPARSVTPPAPFEQACFGSGEVPACNAAALAAIDAARAAEGYGPLILPGDFLSLSDARQLLVVADAERTSRGLPAFPDNPALDRMARAGAAANADPSGPSGYAWGSNISWGYPTPLAADFAWMYDDGPGGPNADCQAAGDPGCWGHRHNILAPWPGAAGTAALHGTQGWVDTELFVERY